MIENPIIGVNQAAVNVSGMLGAAVMPALAVAFSWRAGFVFAAVVAFAVCGVALAFYRDPRAEESRAVASEAPGPEVTEGRSRGRRRPGRSPCTRSSRACRA